MASAMSPYSYDKEFWNAYADENEARYDAEFAGRIAYATDALHCTSVLEVGCGTGIDLRLLPENVHALGLDPNNMAVTAARGYMPFADFVRGMITDMPFADSSIDLVFTHRLLNYLDEKTLAMGMQEMYRVAKKYVISCEWFGEKEDAMDGRRTLRNMALRWSDMGAEIMSDTPIHASEPAPDEYAKTRLTLIHAG